MTYMVKSHDATGPVYLHDYRVYQGKVVDVVWERKQRYGLRFEDRNLVVRLCRRIGDAPRPIALTPTGMFARLERIEKRSAAMAEATALALRGRHVEAQSILAAADEQASPSEGEAQQEKAR